MRRSEAQVIAQVIEKVDGGCSYCIREACRDLTSRNLGWVWTPSESGYNVEVRRCDHTCDACGGVLKGDTLENGCGEPCGFVMMKSGYGTPPWKPEDRDE